MLIFLCVIAAAGLVGYSVYYYYSATPSDKSMPMRVMGSLALALAAIASAIATYFGSTGAVP